MTKHFIQPNCIKKFQLLCYSDQLIMFLSLSPPLFLSYHSMLYIQMSNPENQKGNRGTEPAKTGRQEIRQHIRDSATSERAD